MQSVERCVKLISEAAMKVCGVTATVDIFHKNFKQGRRFKRLTTRNNIIRTYNIQFASGIIKYLSNL